MKYVVLVSHGTFAPGLHSVLKMLAGGEREDVISVGLEDGMSAQRNSAMRSARSQKTMRSFFLVTLWVDHLLQMQLNRYQTKD